MKPLIIGMAGGTASGKTTIARAFAARTGATLLGHDRYYRDFPDPSAANFDHPDALDTALLVDHLDELRGGGSAYVPRYDFATHRRVPERDHVEPAPLVLVEGILVLTDEALRARFDITVFVDCPDDVRLLRRMLRDLRERGRDVEGVARQYLATVRPMHQTFVVPSAVHAQVRLDGQQPTDHEVDRLIREARA